MIVGIQQIYLGEEIRQKVKKKIYARRLLHPPSPFYKKMAITVTLSHTLRTGMSRMARWVSSYAADRPW